LFSPFGSVFVGWINDSSAFVAIQNTENVKKAAGQLVGVSGRDYRVYFYSTYVNQLSKNKGGNKAISNTTLVNSPAAANNNTSTTTANSNSTTKAVTKEAKTKRTEEESNILKEKRKRGEKVPDSDGKQSDDSSSGPDADLKKIKTKYILLIIESFNLKKSSNFNSPRVSSSVIKVEEQLTTNGGNLELKLAFYNQDSLVYP
jgi:hypothetical protein